MRVLLRVWEETERIRKMSDRRVAPECDHDGRRERRALEGFTRLRGDASWCLGDVMMNRGSRAETPATPE